MYSPIIQKEDGPTTVKATLSGFSTTDDQKEHGFHIHAEGKTGDFCSDAKGHYNPHWKTHGGPTDVER